MRFFANTMNGKPKGNAKRSLTAYTAMCALAAAFALAACDREPQYPPSPIPPRQPPPEGYVWTELPELTDKENCVVVTHSETFGGVYGRSFTMLYDTEAKLAHWVAYPMHDIYFRITGGVDRGDFEYDPQVSSSYQMPITNYSYGVSGLERGHQIASADRNRTRNQNDQTFFVTNMTPQDGTLNGGQWATLETWVRTKALQEGRYDTLYVVTGCAVSTPENPNVNTITVRGVTGALPQAYYKVLLRTRSAYPNFPSDDDAMCIGVWMENRAPSDSWKNHTLSVAEIERRTGFNFFPSLSTDTKTVYNPTEWGI